MVKINFLTEKENGNSRAINFPLFKNKKLLSDMGVNLIFIWDNPYADKIIECDALWINSKVFRAWWKFKKESLLERLDFFKSHIKNVIYLDTTDSSGTLQQEVLPYVSRYYKSFLLKDKRLYLNRLYGGRIYTDFYHRQFNVFDTEETPGKLWTVEDEKYLSKLRVSWNHTFGYRSYIFFNIFSFSRIRFIAPDRSRSIPVVCRIGLTHKRETIRYQRERICSILKDMGIPTNKLNYRQYVKELRNSKIGISPFGAGEFAYRDFDIIINGCLLFKPDMSHLETWPNLYEENVTYVPFSWDFSDFKDKLTAILNKPTVIQEYAKAAQNRLKWFRESQEASESFCKRVVEMIKEN